MQSSRALLVCIDATNRNVIIAMESGLCESMSKPKKPQMSDQEATVRRINEKGVVIFEGTVITCAQTGQVIAIDHDEAPDSGHAMLAADGEIVFVRHYDGESHQYH